MTRFVLDVRWAPPVLFGLWWGPNYLDGMTAGLLSCCLLGLAGQRFPLLVAVTIAIFVPAWVFVFPDGSLLRDGPLGMGLLMGALGSTGMLTVPQGHECSAKAAARMMGWLCGILAWGLLLPWEHIPLMALVPLTLGGTRFALAPPQDQVTRANAKDLALGAAVACATGGYAVTTLIAFYSLHAGPPPQ